MEWRSEGHQTLGEGDSLTPNGGLYLRLGLGLSDACTFRVTTTMPDSHMGTDLLLNGNFSECFDAA